MRRLLIFWLAIVSAAAPSWAEVPSGFPTVLWEIRWERLPDTDRIQMILRALAPGLEDRGFESAQGDMDYLCATYGAPLARLEHARAEEIVVNLADQPVARGTTNPDAIQFFALYQVEGGRCISEDF